MKTCSHLGSWQCINVSLISHVKKLLNEGDISQTEYDAFFDDCLCYHKESFLYTVKWYAVSDCWKKQHFFTFLNQKVAFKMYWVMWKAEQIC